MKRLIRKSDLLLIAAVLIAAGLLLVLRAAVRRDGGRVVVYVDGRETASYPLEQDAEIPLENDYGYNLLVIRGGEASVTEADCPDRICVQTRSIRHAGERIICLPHRTEVRIEDAGAEGVDLVS